YRSVNVSDPDALAGLVSAVTREFGGLNGIFHTAGVVRDQFILGKTEAEVREVFAAKVSGALHLDEATRGLELNFFVLFSSMAGVIGNAGQSDYAAANAVLDQFAQIRNGRVQRGERRGRTVSINWPLWQAGGMQVDEKVERRFEMQFGLIPLESIRGLRFLSEAIAADYDQAWVMQGDVPRLRLAFLSPAKAASADRSPTMPSANFFAEMQERRTADYLRKLLSSVLKLPPHRIEADASWENYGIDSVMAMDLTFQLEEVFGVLPKTLFFEYQTLRGLADYFVRTQAAKLASLLPAPTPLVAPEPPSLPRTVALDDMPAKAMSVAKPSASQSAEAGAGAEGIAIIGVAGRYPKARNLEAFWENLKQGRDCITEIPADRWDHGLYFDTDPNAPGKTYSKWGGFIDGIAEFDPLFFNISPREAAILDPQERLFLQCAYHTAEDAGYTRESFGTPEAGGAERRVGVFVGVMYEEYQLYGAQETDRGRPMALTGSPASIANRVSYFFDLHGPSLAVDTMCSSSLSALHLACQSLLRGECQMAFAGGVNLSVHPNKYLMLAQGRFASSKGRCESFGEGAEGYVPSEGVGAVLLKPLSRALADGDRIQAVIRGTSINHGGRTHSYTVPNPNAQAQVIGRALDEAHVEARTIGYLEAHGTGTSLGDPIEIAGLVKAFGRGTTDRQFCALGSVKSNIGHGESAAGIAALTKVLLQLRHRQIAPSLHSRVLNPKIDFSQTPFVVQQELAAWPQSPGHPRRAGISSFGAGGGNAHVILEEAPESVMTAPVKGGQPVLMVLSAKTAERLRVLAAAMAGALADPGLQLPGVAWTLQVGREALEERMAFVAASREQAREIFSRFAAGEMGIAGVFSGNARRQRETIAALSRDEDMDRTLAAWMRKGRVERVLELWSQGLEVDWRALTPAPWPRQAPLPHYPFAQEHCWFSDAPAGLTKPAPAETREESRVSVFLRREWEAMGLSKGTEVRGFTVILASRETQELAHRVAALVSPSRVLLVESLDDGDLAADGGLSEFAACIDLVGMGRTIPNEAGWMRWLQRVIGGRTSGELRLLGVTCGLESFQNRKVNVAGATRAALYRMLSAEYAGLRSVHLDLDPDEMASEQAAAVVEQLRRAGGEPEACRRSGTAYRPVLREFSFGNGTQTAPGFPADRIVWITGGTRGLGALCALHFVKRHGARKIVLTGVEPLPERIAWDALRAAPGPEGERIRTIEALEQQGAEVEVLPLDLTDSASVRVVVADVVRRRGRIGGILHCAGTSDRANPAWVRKPIDSVQRVLAPKTLGLDALADAVRGEPLDFFVLFSSVSAAVPALATGLSDYSMANAYMDCQAEARAGELPLLSIQWPRWNEAGAAAGAADAESYRERGFLSHSNAEGLALLDRLLAARCRGVVLPAWVDRSRWRPQDLLLPITNPKPAPKRGTVPAAMSPVIAIVPAMAAGPVSIGDLRDAVGAWLKDLLSRELRLDASRIDADTSFADYGSDSVLLAQVLRSVNQRLGIELDPSILLEHPTIHAFANWLIQKHPDLLSGFVPGTGSHAADHKEPVRPISPPAPESIRVPSGTAPPRVRAGDLAVVGLSCRLPGAANLEEYWELLRSGRKAIDFAPAERWGQGSRFPAGLLADVGLFDPEFFLIREDDARAMDPQAFLLLEEALRTVCHAGYSVDELKRQPIGVYIGGRARPTADADALAEARNPIRAAGNNYLAANISQFFDWQGPSLVLDTACSSALVALQMAAQALASGEINAALVGGVSVLESDQAHRLFQSRGILAATPDFHLFDARAGGIVPAEGAGAVLLKTVAQALADGDRIHAVVSGIAVNNDGRTAGPATPNLE
ncbi:MAG TPA: beta-ketoacyl synthase N-terminal-like domain-containing protein, partial [Candidatus Limnocylindria bacterium]|nr:beta-ketoacyl synthase N-terminal-like domain-containing protein [Candidatus Limnocylindria bacterium]